MARRPTRRQLSVIEDALETWSPSMRRAFLASFQTVRDEAHVSAIVAALEAGNISAAVDAVGLNRAAFRPLEDTLDDAVTATGRATITGLRLPESTVAVVRFDGRNPRAEAWLGSHSSDLVTRITSDQRTSIQTFLEEAMEQGRNPRTVTLDLVGRVDRSTGLRSGGIIGLSAPQEKYVASAYQELISGDPSLLRNYLSRERRDHRFDRTVLRHIEDGTPIDPAIAQRMVDGYSSRLLALRAETIGRTEMLQALHRAQDEAIRQAIDSGLIREEDVLRVWNTASDSRVRDSHAALDQKTAKLNEAFVSPVSGAALMFPGDGPASEAINCRCYLELKVDFLADIDREREEQGGTPPAPPAFDTDAAVERAVASQNHHQEFGGPLSGQDAWLRSFAEERWPGQVSEVLDGTAFTASEGMHIWRGVKRREFVPAQYGPDNFVGTGVYGSGTYQGVRGSTHVSFDYSDSHGWVTVSKIRPDARVTTMSALEQELSSWKDANPDIEFADPRYHFNTDIGRFAAYRGYDGYEVESERYIVITNKRAVVVNRDTLPGGAYDQMARSADRPFLEDLHRDLTSQRAAAQTRMDEMMVRIRAGAGTVEQRDALATEFAEQSVMVRNIDRVMRNVEGIARTGVQQEYDVMQILQALYTRDFS